MSAKTRTIHFSFEKSTKNTHKFEEVEQPGQAKIIGSLYVQKHAFNGSVPKNITVMLGWEE
jgi:hypothetical protein